MKPDHARTISLLSYDEETGELRWRENHALRRGNRGLSGEIAGHLATPTTKKNKSYIRVTIDGQRYMAHTVIWFMKTGEWLPCGIDHRDGEGTNNRWSNLRRCTATQNNGNQSIRSDNTSGKKGVTYKSDRPRSKPWSVTCKGKFIGYYATIEEAAAAYDEAAERLFGEFAKPNTK